MRTNRQRLTSRDVAQGMASNKQIAERLEIARNALKLDQSEFADLAGVSRQAYNNWIKLRSQPRIDQAILICEAHGLTLDWIYRGRLPGLPYDIHEAAAKASRTKRT